MTEATNSAVGTPVTDSKAPEPKTVANDMKGRAIFATPEKAQEYLSGLGESLTDFADHAFATVGISEDEEGNPVWDSELYTGDTQVMVATLRAASKVKAIIVTPIPTLDAILANEEAKAWAWRVLLKELNHVAVRPLRDADDISTVVDQMPKTLSEYISSQRDSSGIIETYNELYKQINATLSAARPAWAKARLTKSELRKAMESKGYAAETYSALEDYKGASLFEFAIKLGKQAAERKALDPTIFDRWLSTRATKVYKPGEEQEEADLDIDSLTNSLLTEEKATAAEGETKQEDAPAPADATA